MNQARSRLAETPAAKCPRLVRKRFLSSHARYPHAWLAVDAQQRPRTAAAPNDEEIPFERVETEEPSEFVKYLKNIIQPFVEESLSKSGDVSLFASVCCGLC